MSDSQTLMIERRSGVAILSFNRPRVLNAFDGPLVEATTRAMAELSADDSVLAIVVRGEGRAFSAGFDLKAGAAKMALSQGCEYLHNEKEQGQPQHPDERNRGGKRE